MIFRAIALGLVLSLSSCAAAMPVISQVIAAATQASDIIDMIADDAGKLPLPSDLKARLDKAIADCRLALVAAYEAANGAKDLSNEEADAALARFRAAWDALQPLLKEAGLMKTPGKLGASPDTTIPTPTLALKRFNRS